MIVAVGPVANAFIHCAGQVQGVTFKTQTCYTITLR